ncbi:DUF2782 domain-containing protein [Mangrovitalea sediminis]|uniref:DUF2782 domain-containing protein n=1 Tax=Mangrovitalea sediminis TaxID=1982043 RepID=UPI000BE526D0|nr:DUF2782 domain-containing protein [Mangrovitalea sediminis]
MKRKINAVLLGVSLAVGMAGGAHAEESAKLSEQKAEPSLPSQDGSEIVIRHREDKTFYEYRVNGVLKEIKVVPKHGPAYYLVPQDGNGWIREDKPQVLVPSWVLFRW